MTSSRMHPQWCFRRQCTAYADVERCNHRTKPLIIPTNDDPLIAWYVHLGANADSSDPYLEITELEKPLRGTWWHPIAPVSELIMPLDEAQRLRGVLNGLLAGDPTPKATPK